MGKGQRVVLPGSLVQVLPPWPVSSHQHEATEPGIREVHLGPRTPCTDTHRTDESTRK